MSATMERQGGRVQLEQSNMRPAWNMAKMAKKRDSRATIGEEKYLIHNHAPRSEKRSSGVLSFLGITR